MVDVSFLVDEVVTAVVVFGVAFADVVVVADVFEVDFDGSLAAKVSAVLSAPAILECGIALLISSHSDARGMRKESSKVRISSGQLLYMHIATSSSSCDLAPLHMHLTSVVLQPSVFIQLVTQLENVVDVASTWAEKESNTASAKPANRTCLATTIVCNFWYNRE